jgi:hypothetical protein
MNNEPVAIRYDFDGYGYQYIDSGSGSDWLTRVDGELLYTQPNEHDLGIAEAIGFDKGYKAATAKTLTANEIEDCYQLWQALSGDPEKLYQLFKIKEQKE